MNIDVIWQKMVSAEELRSIATQAINNDPVPKIIEYIVDETDILTNTARREENSQRKSRSREQQITPNVVYP